MDEEMAPKKAGETMIPTTIRLPVELDKQVREMAERKGVDLSMLLRALIERGYAAVCQDEAAALEYENKVLVNRKLKLSIAQIESQQLNDEVSSNL